MIVREEFGNLLGRKNFEGSVLRGRTLTLADIRSELYEALLTLNTGNQTFLFDHNRQRYDVRRNNFTYDFNKVMKKAEIKDIRVMPEGGRGRKKSRVGFHSLRKRFI